MSETPKPDIILISAPIGADAANLSTVLARAGHAPRICRSVEEVVAGLTLDCGAVIFTEEALSRELKLALARIFEGQPPWSDIPVILLSTAGPANLGPALAAELRGARRSITLLDRPLRAATLLAALDTLLAARHRQYEVRDLLHERDALLSSLETRVAERTAELKQMVEEMEGFSYSVSHDLRSPLRSLAGYAQALQEDYGQALPPGARLYCEKMIRAAQRMDNLTQDVLAYTRVARCEMAITPVDLDSLLTEVIEQYPSLVSVAGSIRIHRPLGYVQGHVPSLIQCFSNLLGNAVKFVPDGRVPHVEVRATLRGSRRHVSVRDNGIGVDANDHERIFRMFERAAGKKIPGTGIGLAIVKKAVERMGGRVGVFSVAGQGSEFWIELENAEPSSSPVSTIKDLATFWPEPAPDTPLPFALPAP